MHRRLSAADGSVRMSPVATDRRGTVRGPSRRDDRPQDLLFLPMGYEPTYRYPLVVWLPDAREDLDRFDLARSMSRLSLRNFVAVLPQAGLASDPERAVWRAIDRAAREASIHPDRIYLVGDGGGGTEAFRIACRHPGGFGGVVSLGGGFPLGESAFARLADVRRLSMLLCCHRRAALRPADPGSMDRTLRLFHAAGASLSVRIYPDGRSVGRAALGDVNRWIMEQVCGAAQPASSVLGGR